VAARLTQNLVAQGIIGFKIFPGSGCLDCDHGAASSSKAQNYTNVKPIILPDAQNAFYPAINKTQTTL
jgi:hypothetical protein